jgi:hypothetical protein
LASFQQLSISIIRDFTKPTKYQKYRIKSYKLENQDLKFQKENDKEILKKKNLEEHQQRRGLMKS